MSRNVSEIPDNWVVVKITNNGESNYKVFGAWVGGYLSGDAWKLNSGVSKVEEDENNYYFHGHSGSCYQCGKGHYGVRTSYTAMVLDEIIESGKNNNVDVEMMDENTNWLELV